MGAFAKKWVESVVSVSLVLFGGLPASCLAMAISDIPAVIAGHNHDVRAAELDVEAAESYIQAARAKHYPSLEIRGAYVHLGEEIQFQLPAQTIGGSIASVTFTLPPIDIHKQDFLMSSLIVKMPIFVGGRIVALTSAREAQRDEAEANRRKASEEKIQEGLQRYFGVQLARQVTRALTDMQVNLERIHQISKSLVTSGLGTKYAVLQVEVAQAELGSRLAEAKGKAEIAELAFKSTIGKAALDEVTFDTPLVKVPMPEKSDEFRLQAVHKRHEFDLLKSKQEQAGALKRVATGAMLPAIYAVGGYQLGGVNLTVRNPRWAVGVVVDVPLTGFLEGLPERAAAASLEQKAEVIREKANADIPLQVEKTYVEARALDAAYLATEQAVSVAREALRLAEIRFKNGTGSALEVLQSVTELEKIEIRRSQLGEEYNRRLIDLFFVSGEVAQFIPAYEKYAKSS